MSKRNKLVFISDIHMGAGHDKFDWLSGTEADALADFLNVLISTPDVKELVIIGDLFDNWIYPIDVSPPSFTEIINAPKNKKLVRVLKSICTHPDITVTYVPGNHDMSVTPNFMRTNFKGIKFKQLGFYRNGVVHAEHGHSVGLFNGPDPVNDPKNHLPLGYYLSRIEATILATSSHSGRKWWTYIDDLLDVNRKNLPEKVLEAIIEEANLPKNVTIKMPGYYGGGTITTDEVKKRYSRLYLQRLEESSRDWAIKCIKADIKMLRPIAQVYFDDETRVVVFGHSHSRRVKEENFFSDDRNIYVNSGTWCETEKTVPRPLTFVECWEDSVAQKYRVRLKAWDPDSKKISKISGRSLDL